MVVGATVTPAATRGVVVVVVVGGVVVDAGRVVATAGIVVVVVAAGKVVVAAGKVVVAAGKVVVVAGGVKVFVNSQLMSGFDMKSGLPTSVKVTFPSSMS